MINVALRSSSSLRGVRQVQRHCSLVSRRRNLTTTCRAHARKTSSMDSKYHDGCISLVEKVLMGTWASAGKAGGPDTSQVSWGLLCATLLAAGMLTIPCGEALAVGNNVHQTPMTLYDIAENEDFWANVLRYVSYFFSVLLGTAYVAFKPILELLKRPTTAVLVIGAAIGLYYFVSTTVSAMLGVNEYGYEPSSIVTPYIN